MTTRCQGSRSGGPACDTLQAVVNIKDASQMLTTAERRELYDPTGANPYEVSAVLACGHSAKFVCSARQLTAWQRAHAIALPA